MVQRSDDAGRPRLPYIIKRYRIVRPIPPPVCSIAMPSQSCYTNNGDTHDDYHTCFSPAANSAGLLIDPAHSQRIISAYQFNFLSYNFRLALLISS